MLKERFAGEPLYLMDGSAFVYRGFYANQGLARSDGFPTNALLIVARTLLKILREEQPRRFVFVLDGKSKNFRHDLYPDYKAQRKSMPEGLIVQMEPIRAMVRALGVPLLVTEGCEADDAIASLAHRFSEPGVVIVGADKDLKQCLSEHIVLWDPASREGKLTTRDDFMAETGLEPAQWPDMQAVIGDSSDNIPGIPGVGVKTAAKIFQDFGSLEEIRDNMSRMAPTIRKKFEGHLEAMFLYRQLTRLSLDCHSNLTEADLLVTQVNVPAAVALLREYELATLTRDVQRMVGQNGITGTGGAGETAGTGTGEAGEAGAMQGSLLTGPEKMAQISCESPDQLPDITGRTVAVLPAVLPENLPAEQAILLALNDADGKGGNEWLYTGPVESLIQHLCRAVASSRETLLVTPDVKRLIHQFHDMIRIPAHRWLDLSLCAYLLDPEQQDYGWPKLAGEWSANLNLAPGNPGLLALRMAAAFLPRLEGARLLDLLRELELPLVPVLAAMESAGVLLDTVRLADYLDSVQGDVDRLTTEIHTLAGGPFNIRSAQQLGEVLFKRLGLMAMRKTQGGQASTNRDVLEQLSGKHPIISALRDYRILDKLRSTYLEPLPRLIGADGRIRTTFNQTGTATGRLSSSNPNLQNIPVRGPLGQRMRACFTAESGMALVSADYSQIELRVLACMSNDQALLAAFREGADIHARTAGLLYETPADKISPEQRRAAKTINFGLIYGMGAQKLAQELSISVADAHQFISRYFDRLTGLRDFYASVKEQAREQGYVTTLTGRRRLLPNIASASLQLRALAERQAVNSIIQGSAADIIKLAMLAVYHDPALRSQNARLLLQIHDELLLEAPQDQAAEVGARVVALMSSVTPGGKALEIPLLVECGVGTNWSEAH